MRCRVLFLVALTIWFWPEAPAFAAPAVESFTPKERQTLDAATTAWFRGDAPAAVARLAALVERLDDQRRAALDDVLASQQMPSLTQLVTKSRLATLEQGGGKIPRLQVREALIVLPAIENRIAETVKAVEKSRTSDDGLPGGATLDEYDELLWETHVLSNRLAAAKSIVDRASQLIHITPRESERLSEAQRELVRKRLSCGLQATRATRRRAVRSRSRAPHEAVGPFARVPGVARAQSRASAGGLLLAGRYRTYQSLSGNRPPSPREGCAFSAGRFERSALASATPAEGQASGAPGGRSECQGLLAV